MKLKKLLLERGYNTPKNGNMFFWDFYALYELWYRVGSGYSGTKSSSPDANVYQFHPDTKIPNEKRSHIIDDVFEDCARKLANQMYKYLMMASIEEFANITENSTLYNFCKELMFPVGASNYKTDEWDYHYDGPKYDYSKVNKDFIEHFKKKYLPNISMRLISKLMKFATLRHHTHKEEEYRIALNLFNKVYDESVMENLIVSGRGSSDNGSDDIPDKYEMVSLDYTRKVLSYMQQSGLTLKDVIVCFEQIEWPKEGPSESYGGQMWANILKEAMKIEGKTESMSLIDLSVWIDHIYDMEHNTGSVLNKGVLYVNKDNLNKRHNIKHISEYLSVTSFQVQHLITSNLHFFSSKK